MWQRASEWAAQGELRPSGTERNDSFLLSLLAPVVVGGFLESCPVACLVSAWTEQGDLRDGDGVIRDGSFFLSPRLPCFCETFLGIWDRWHVSLGCKIAYPLQKIVYVPSGHLMWDFTGKLVHFTWNVYAVKDVECIRCKRIYARYRDSVCFRLIYNLSVSIASRFSLLVIQISKADYHISENK